MIYDPAVNKSLNNNLEALRGFAAFFVFFSHIEVLHDYFNPGYMPLVMQLFAPSGHLFVLVFFVLSGFVISASNMQGLQASNIGLYLKKRFVRLYPIYFIALLITLALAVNLYQISNIFYNFGLLQVLIVPPFVENGAAWSLHYEVFYYLLFIPISFFRMDGRLTWLLALIIGIGNFYFYPNPGTAILSSYFLGFTFWMAGFCIARYVLREERDISYSFLSGALLMLLAIDQMLIRSGFSTSADTISYWLTGKHLIYPDLVPATQKIISSRDLAYLPYCIYFVIVFAGRRISYQRLFFILLQVPLLWSVVVTFYNILFTKQSHQLPFLIPFFYYVAGLVLMFGKVRVEAVSKQVIRLGAWFGAISYAMYIIHHQFIYSMGQVHFVHHAVVDYVLKLVVCMVVVLGLSFLLERKFQPWIRKFFFK